MIEDITQSKPYNTFYVSKLNTQIESPFSEEIMNLGKYINNIGKLQLSMGFMIKSIENMAILILGSIVLKFLTIYLLELLLTVSFPLLRQGFLCTWWTESLN